MWIAPPPKTSTLLVRYVAAERQRLPSFLGSAVHGAFGHALKRIACVRPKRTSCVGCPDALGCGYAELFEAPASEHARNLLRGVQQQAPRPVAVAPDGSWPRFAAAGNVVAEGAEVRVRVVLIGRAVELHRPLAVRALRDVADLGLGITHTEGRWRRARLSPSVAIENDDTDDLPSPSSMREVNEASLTLVSPLRIKSGGRLLSRLSAGALLTALVRRVNALSILYGVGTPSVDEHAVAAQAEGIEVADDRTRLVAVTRWSERQRRRMTWPGIVGALHLHGRNLGEVWPLLRLGERVQVGKGTTVGFGRYVVGFASRSAAEPVLDLARQPLTLPHARGGPS